WNSPVKTESLFSDVPARDGRKLRLFKRYRGLFGKPAPVMASLPEQLTKADLDGIVENGTACVYYQHLGVASKNADGTNNAAVPPYFSPQVLDRLGHLSRIQREGLCLVAGVGRLLTYLDVRDTLASNVIDDVLVLTTSRQGTRLQDFEGVTIEIDAEAI